MKIKIVYDKTYHDRRLVVIHHDPVIENGWYCGYMQVLPQDKEYKSVHGTHTGYWDLSDDAYPTAIGGITWTGTLGGPYNDGKTYVGFDTDHFNTQNSTLEDCIKSLKGMVRYEESEDKR